LFQVTFHATLTPFVATPKRFQAFMLIFQN
jgi:hypothetical protein